MNAQDSILVLLLQEGAQRHPLKQIIHLLEDTVWVVNIFIESLGTLLAEAQILVDVTILMIASEQENLARVLQPKCKKHANDF